MSFQIPSYRELQVNPALPASLKRLPELAHNLLWSWDHHLRTVFRRLDPITWRASHNPVLMLSSLPQQTLEKAAADARFMAVYERACERFDAYMKFVAYKKTSVPFHSGCDDEEEPCDIQFAIEEMYEKYTSFLETKDSNKQNAASNKKKNGCC